MLSLESVAPPGIEQAETEQAEPEQAEPEPAEAESADSAESAEPEIVEPPPKRRGRPKAEPATPKAKAKAAPAKAAPAKPTRKAAPTTAVRMKKPVYESSSEEDMPINKEDMDTMLLSYLLQRKHAQQDHRRTMWTHMAGLS